MVEAPELKPLKAMPESDTASNMLESDFYRKWKTARNLDDDSTVYSGVANGRRCGEHVLLSFFLVGNTFLFFF